MQCTLTNIACGFSVNYASTSEGVIKLSQVESDPTNSYDTSRGAYMVPVTGELTTSATLTSLPKPTLSGRYLSNNLVTLPYMSEGGRGVSGVACEGHRGTGPGSAIVQIQQASQQTCMLKLERSKKLVMFTV